MIRFTVTHFCFLFMLAIRYSMYTSERWQGVKVSHDLNCICPIHVHNLVTIWDQCLSQKFRCVNWVYMPFFAKSVLHWVIIAGRPVSKVCIKVYACIKKCVCLCKFCPYTIHTLHMFYAPLSNLSKCQLTNQCHPSRVGSSSNWTIFNSRPSLLSVATIIYATSSFELVYLLTSSSFPPIIMIGSSLLGLTIWCNEKHFVDAVNCSSSSTSIKNTTNIMPKGANFLSEEDIWQGLIVEEFTEGWKTCRVKWETNTNLNWCIRKNERLL